jgi:hypothetical protein
MRRLAVGWGLGTAANRSRNTSPPCPPKTPPKRPAGPVRPSGRHPSRRAGSAAAAGAHTSTCRAVAGGVRVSVWGGVRTCHVWAPHGRLPCRPHPRALPCRPVRLSGHMHWALGPPWPTMPSPKSRDGAGASPVSSPPPASHALCLPLASMATAATRPGPHAAHCQRQAFPKRHGPPAPPPPPPPPPREACMALWAWFFPIVAAAGCWNARRLDRPPGWKSSTENGTARRPHPCAHPFGLPRGADILPAPCELRETVESCIAAGGRMVAAA